MKRILIFACLLSLATAMTSDELFQKFMGYMKGTAEKCATEMGLHEDVIDRFVVERHSTDIEPMGLLKACVMKNTGQIVDGQLSMKALYDLADAAVGRESEIVKKCYEVQDNCAERLKYLKGDHRLALEFVNCASISSDYIV